MADVLGGLTYERAWLLRPQHGPKKLHQRKAVGITLAYIPSDGTRGAIYGGGNTQLQILMQAHKMAHQEGDDHTA